MPERIRFTKKKIEDLPTPAGSRTILYDDEVRTLIVKVEPSGTKSFHWYKSVHSVPIWREIGGFPALSVEQARTEARSKDTAAARWKASGYEGPSPFDKPKPVEQKNAGHTLQMAFDDYCKLHLSENAKNPERALAESKRMFELHVPKSLRDTPLADITKREILILHSGLVAAARDQKPFVANRVLQMLRAVINHAIDKAETFTGKNPCGKIVTINEKKYRRSRFLDRKSELPKFLKALAAGKKSNRDLHDAVWLALLCGPRRGDLLSVRWENLNLDPQPGKMGTWLVPDPKNEIPYTISLQPEAVEVLKSRRELVGDSLFVFPFHGKPNVHIKDFKTSWTTFRKNAGFTGLRFHDLRRTFGSHAVQNGVPLYTVSKMLGHANSATVTETYSHLTREVIDEGVRAATAGMLKAAPKAMRRGPKIGCPAPFRTGPCHFR
jgi:integrase